MVIQSSSVSMNSKRSYASRKEERVGSDSLGIQEETEKRKVKNAEKSENPYKGKSISQIRSEVLNYLLNLFFGEKKTGNFLEQINGGGVNYTRSSFFYEKETTTFQTKGSVITADGRELSFHIDVEMTRSFTSYMEETINIGAANVCDPLVINLDTNVASVSDQKFLFDIDADGTKDLVSMPKKGSGFLALDKNHNGSIDDGSELFGTKSGDGFADLEEYDIDKNGWIDEADEIFDMLRIWTKDESGNNRLIGLKEAGVGAICLKNTDTQFSLNSRLGNRTNAYIRKTGIFLYEHGGSGTIQHLDLVQ